MKKLKTYRITLLALLIITTAFEANSQSIKWVTRNGVMSWDTAFTSGSEKPYTISAVLLTEEIRKSNDTICVDRQQFIRMLTKAEQGKGFEQLRDLLLNQVDTLKARITIKEMLIINLNGQISDYKSIISSKDAIISTQADQRKIFEANNAALNKELKKQRRAKKWTALAGLLTTVIATFLLITK